MKERNTQQDGVYINDDKIGYKAFLKSKERKKIELDRIDRLEQIIEELKDRLSVLEQKSKGIR